MTDNSIALFQLAHKWSLAKKAETAAKEDRFALEEQIVTLTGFKKKVGSETFPAACAAGSAKLTLKQPVTVTVLEDAIPALRKELTRGQFARVFRTKHSVVAKELKVLEEDPKLRDIFLLVKGVLSSKPGKVGVELKSIEVL